MLWLQVLAKDWAYTYTLLSCAPELCATPKWIERQQLLPTLRFANFAGRRRISKAPHCSRLPQEDASWNLIFVTGFDLLCVLAEFLRLEDRLKLPTKKDIMHMRNEVRIPHDDSPGEGSHGSPSATMTGMYGTGPYQQRSKQRLLAIRDSTQDAVQT